MKILIIGSVRSGNIGDNLLGLITQRIVRQIIPGAEVLVENSSRFDLVDSADAVIVGPGGIIDDVEIHNVNNYLQFLSRAQERKIPNMMIGAGVQRLKAPAAIELCRKVLNQTDFISVRSQGDAQILADIGIYAPLYTLQDMAFTLKSRRLRHSLAYSGRSEGRSKWLSRNWNRKPALGFSLMNWDIHHVDRSKIQTGMKHIADQYTAYILSNFGKLTKHFDVSLICQSVDDMPLYRRIADDYPVHVINFYDASFEQAMRLYAVYKKMDYVLTGRLHGLIISGLAGKPLMNVSIGNHKQAKLLGTDLQSLLKVNYRLEQLYEEDLFGAFVEKYKAGQLLKANRNEIARCARLANINKRLLAQHLQPALKDHRIKAKMTAFGYGGQV